MKRITTIKSLLNNNLLNESNQKSNNGICPWCNKHYKSKLYKHMRTCIIKMNLLFERINELEKIK